MKNDLEIIFPTDNAFLNQFLQNPDARDVNMIETLHGQRLYMRYIVMLQPLRNEFELYTPRC